MENHNKIKMERRKNNENALTIICQLTIVCPIIVTINCTYTYVSGGVSNETLNK